jgi:hypothetical protein
MQSTIFIKEDVNITESFTMSKTCVELFQILLLSTGSTDGRYHSEGMEENSKAKCDPKVHANL